MLEHSPVGRPQGNGAVERATRPEEKHVRVREDAVEMKPGCISAAGHPAMPWRPQQCRATDAVFRWQ